MNSKHAPVTAVVHPKSLKTEPGSSLKSQGCFPNHARFFDPEHYRVVLFDQRGCGRSTPKGAVRNNDIEALVRDIEALREHLGLERCDSYR